jgi:hypothetical protein
MHNPMMYPYTKFELNVCNRSKDNEQKPVMEWMTEWRSEGMTEWRNDEG